MWFFSPYCIGEIPPLPFPAGAVDRRPVVLPLDSAPSAFKEKGDIDLWSSLSVHLSPFLAHGKRCALWTSKTDLPSTL